MTLDSAELTDLRERIYESTLEILIGLNGQLRSVENYYRPVDETNTLQILVNLVQRMFLGDGHSDVLSCYPDVIGALLVTIRQVVLKLRLVPELYAPQSTIDWYAVHKIVEDMLHTVIRLQQVFTLYEDACNLQDQVLRH